MSRLDEAKIILDALTIHMAEQTSAASTLAAEKKYIEANKLLEVEVGYANAQIALALHKRTASRKSHFWSADKRLTALNSLQTNTAALRDAMQASITTYAQAEVARSAAPAAITAEQEAAHIAAEKEPPPLISLEEESYLEYDVDPESGSEADYTAAMKQLTNYKAKPHPEEIDESLNKLIAQITLLKEKGDDSIDDLTEVLESTYQRLSGEMDHEEYHAISKTIEGGPSLGLKILGGIMLALGAVIATLALALTSGMGLLAPGITSFVFAAGGAGFFAKGHKQTGLSQSMNEIDQTLEFAQTHKASAA